MKFQFQTINKLLYPMKSSWYGMLHRKKNPSLKTDKLPHDKRRNKIYKGQKFAPSNSFVC